MRAHLLLVLLPMLPTPATALELTGRYGYAGEWALTATLAEAEPSASKRKRDFAGPEIDARNPQLYEQRRAECARNLFDSPMPDANQLDLFGGVA